MTFTYTKTLDVNFPDAIIIEDVTDFIIDRLCDELPYEIWGDNEHKETFEAIKNEAYRYVATELKNLVE